MTSRRSFITVSLAFTSFAFFSDRALCQVTPTPRVLPRPNPALFESGDFVWPKKPGAYVPYNSGSHNTPAQDRSRWFAERDAYVQRLETATTLTEIERKRLQLLQAMDYREFIAVYAGDQKIGIPGVYSGGSVYVGHVGIIDLDSSGSPWVIEAISRGVVRQTYSDWIDARSDEVIWLGRLGGIGSSERAKIALEASRHVGKPYDFWNFDLNDDNDFYCSKLAWLSIYRSLHFAVDGNPDSQRVFWFSPKQFLYLPSVIRLHDPGPYATA